MKSLVVLEYDFYNRYRVLISTIVSILPNALKPYHTIYGTVCLAVSFDERTKMAAANGSVSDIPLYVRNSRFQNYSKRLFMREQLVVILILDIYAALLV